MVVTEDLNTTLSSSCSCIPLRGRGLTPLSAASWYCLALCILICYGAVNAYFGSSAPDPFEDNHYTGNEKQLAWVTISVVILVDASCLLMRRARLLTTQLSIVFVLALARAILALSGAAQWLVGISCVYGLLGLFLSDVTLTRWFAEAEAAAAAKPHVASSALTSPPTAISTREASPSSSAITTLEAPAEVSNAANSATHPSLPSRVASFFSIRTPASLLALVSVSFSTLIAGLAVDEARGRGANSLPVADTDTSWGYVPQFAFAIGAFFVVLLALGVGATYRFWRKGGRRLNSLGYATGLATCIGSGACGIALYLLTRSPPLLAGFIFVPIAFFAMLCLYGQWLRDDFHVCLRHPSSTRPLSYVRARNAAMIGGAALVLACIAGWGAVVSDLPGVLQPWGWVIALGVFSLLKTVLALQSYFYTLRWSAVQPIAGMLALASHASLHALLLHDYQGNPTALTILALTFVGYPAVVLAFISVCLLADNDWKWSRTTIALLVTSWAAVGSALIAACVVFSNVDVRVPAALLVGFVVLSLAGAALAVWASGLLRTA